ncbi:hypothetical protein [Krasilnikovia sp. M28-CT-15]|uniref:hypothetical protein n=1 Tax=Krasilnikovia sp. M28-CT-15 TaxID=3373540 RepID=UPI003875E7A7
MLDAATLDESRGVRLSVAVMAIPERQEPLDALRARLAPREVQVSFEMTATSRPSALESAAIAWSCAPATSTHHLVLQDDVELSSALLDCVENAARSHPTDALAFFAEWGCKSASPVRVAALLGAGWAEAVDKYAHTQALVLPAEVARDLGAHLARQGADAPPEDVVVHRFLSARGIRELISVPNLVQHLDLPSRTGNGWQGRRHSVCYRPEATALTEAVVSDLATYPFFQWLTGKTLHMRRDDAAHDSWLRESLGPVLERQGWSASHTAQALAESPLQSAPLTAEERKHLAGVVETAAALAMTARGLAPSTDLDYRPGSYGATALGTLGEGALRCVMSTGAMEAVRPHLPALARDVVGSASQMVSEGILRQII